MSILDAIRRLARRTSSDSAVHIHERKEEEVNRESPSEERKKPVVKTPLNWVSLDDQESATQDQSTITSQREDTSGDSTARTSPEIPSELQADKENRVFGVYPQDGRPLTLRDTGRRHTLVLGKTGTGKSTWMLSQMLQDVRHGESVVLVDPHGDLAKQFLTFLPRERWSDVVYLNPLTTYNEGRVVRINFLEPIQGGTSEQDKELAKRAFMSALRKIYEPQKAWGKRLEAILRYSLNLLYAVNDVPTLSGLMDIIGNRNNKRSTYTHVEYNTYKTKVDEETMDFWRHDYPDFEPWHKVAVQNKIYNLVSEEVLAPMTAKTVRSTVNLAEAINEKKIIIVDIPVGQLMSVSDFLGTLILAKLYQAGVVRERIPEEERAPVNVYVDEAHRFLSPIIMDNMRALRKFGLYFTVASQNLREYSGGFQMELPELAGNVVAFNCGRDTAKQIEGEFTARLSGSGRSTGGPHESIMLLPDHNFYLSTTVGGVPEVYLLETVDVKRGPEDENEVIRRSLKEWGERPPVPSEYRSPIPSESPIGRPVEYYILNYLAQAKEERRGFIIKKIRKKYGFNTQVTTRAIDGVLDVGGFITLKFEPESKRRPTVDERDKRYCSLSDGERGGREYLYPTIGGVRAGSPLHITLVCLAMDYYRRKDYLPIPSDVKDKELYGRGFHRTSSESSDFYPDLWVYPPGMEHGEAYEKISPINWDTDRAFMVEIEAFPSGRERKPSLPKPLIDLHRLAVGVEESGKISSKLEGGKGTGGHLDRTVRHYRVGTKKFKVPMVFIVRNKEDKKSVETRLREEGARIIGEVTGGEEPGHVQVMVMRRDMPQDEDLQEQIKRSLSGSEGTEVGEGTEEEEVPVFDELEEKEKAKEGEEDWRARFHRNVEEIRKLRKEEGIPVREIARVLENMGEQGCTFRSQRTKKKMYVIVRKFREGAREESSLGRLNGKMLNALSLAGIEV